MAYYKYPQLLTPLQHKNFDTFLSPGSDASDAGIYRCEGCGHEIGIAKGHTMPPQGHHSHTAAQGSIWWRLIVAAIH